MKRDSFTKESLGVVVVNVLKKYVKMISLHMTQIFRLEKYFAHNHMYVVCSPILLLSSAICRNFFMLAEGSSSFVHNYSRIVEWRKLIWLYFACFEECISNIVWDVMRISINKEIKRCIGRRSSMFYCVIFTKFNKVLRLKFLEPLTGILEWSREVELFEDWQAFIHILCECEIRLSEILDCELSSPASCECKNLLVHATIGSKLGCLAGLKCVLTCMLQQLAIKSLSGKVERIWKMALVSVTE